MKLVAIERLAIQWRVELNSRTNMPAIVAISDSLIEFEDEISQGQLAIIGPGEFVLRVARGENRIHRPSSWRLIERTVGKSKQVVLEWNSDAERAFFARDLLLARQSELFSPAGV